MGFDDPITIGGDQFGAASTGIEHETSMVVGDVMGGDRTECQFRFTPPRDDLEFDSTEIPGPLDKHVGVAGVTGGRRRDGTNELDILCSRLLDHLRDRLRRTLDRVLVKFAGA